MNLRKSGRTLVLVAAVAMLALALQGCGGDDGVSKGRFDDEVAKAAAEEKAADEARKQAAAAEKAKMEAEAAKTAAENAKTAAENAKTAAENAKTAAENAKTAAEAASAADKTRLEEAAAAAKAAADKAEEDQRMAEEKEKKLRDDAMKARDHAMAEKHFANIRSRIVQLLDGTTPSYLPETGFITSRLKLTASTLKAEYPGYEQDTERPRDIPGSSGVRLLRQLDNNDKIVVYSDLPDKKGSFRDVFRRISGETPDAFPLTPDGANNTINRTTARATPTNAGTGATVSTSGTTNTMTGVINYQGTNIPGTFKCTGTATRGGTGACGYTPVQPGRNRDNQPTGPFTYTNITGTGWSFRPTSDVLIGAHYYFGWWMDAAPPDNSEAFGLFYKYIGSARRTAANTLGSAIEGTATYKGGAAGQYAVRAVGEANTQAGDFVADVTFNINFDADKLETTPGPGGVGRIQATAQTVDKNGIIINGVIDKFRGELPDIGNWRVLIPTDDIISIPGSQPMENLVSQTDGDGVDRRMDTIWSMGGSANGAGKIRIDFHGGAADKAPDAAVGIFSARFGSVASMIGSFAATKQKQE